MNEIINKQQLSELKKLDKAMEEIQKSMKGAIDLSKMISDSFGDLTTVLKAVEPVSAEFDKLKKSLAPISDIAKRLSIFTLDL